MYRLFITLANWPKPATAANKDVFYLAYRLLLAQWKFLMVTRDGHFVFLYAFNIAKTFCPYSART